MSNFKGWRAPGAAEAFERAKLEKRLDAKPAPSKAAPITQKVRSVDTIKDRPYNQPTRDHIKTTFIGVDPALRVGGFWLCIICRVDNTATFKSCKHLGEFVTILQDCDPAAVIVENSNLQKQVFDQGSGVGGAISVGKNMGVSQAAADIADQYSEIPSGISPKAKGAKITNDVLFQGIVRANGLKLVGYKGAIKAAQDQRDALKLALIAEQQYNLHSKVKQ
jgi:hypothetical protein